MTKKTASAFRVAGTHFPKKAAPFAKAMPSASKAFLRSVANYRERKQLQQELFLKQVAALAQRKADRTRSKASRRRS